MTKIKICGITRIEDALAAAEYGADAIGFVFYRKSPRYVEPEIVAGIINELPPFITPVGLFVNESEGKVWDTLNVTGINVAQFHGEESPEYVSSFDMRTIKAIHVKNEESLDLALEYKNSSILLDAWSPDAFGGTGKKFEWNMLRKISLKNKFILAGGLTPENVAYAANLIKPYAVDVSSGVEISKGIKDHEKIKAFIDAVKENPGTING